MTRAAWIGLLVGLVASGGAAGCTDRFSANYDPSQAGTNTTDCEAAAPGCTDPASGNYDPAANADDGSCVGACTPDLSWADSDGHGCDDYELGSCGFEESNARCPHMCSKCTTDMRLGCDGAPAASAAVLAMDACGVCDGDGETTTPRGSSCYCPIRIARMPDSSGKSRAGLLFRLGLLVLRVNFRALLHPDGDRVH